MWHSINAVTTRIEYLESLDKPEDNPAHTPLYSSSLFIVIGTFHRTTYPSEHLKPFCLCSLNRAAGQHRWEAAHKGGQIWTDAHFFLAPTTFGSKDTHTHPLS